MFGKELHKMVAIIIGIIVTLIVWFLFSNKNKKIGFLKKHKKILNIIALVICFVGGLLWAIGEWLVYAGLDNHPLLDPVGAFSTALGAFMSLLLYLYD